MQSTYWKNTGLAAALALCALTGMRLEAQSPDNEVCLGCHEQNEKFAKSAHVNVACASCHAGREKFPHAANIPKPQCATCHSREAGDHAGSVHGQELQKGNAAAPDCATCHGPAHEVIRTKALEYRRATVDTCGMCHDKVAVEFRKSVHGAALERGVSEVPTCTDCHGGHNILRPSNPQSTVNARGQRETCGSCHADVRLSRRFGLPTDRIASFDGSFHGLALKSGQQVVASCSSCHGVHNILPSSDPASKVNPKQLASTCGTCHPGAGTRFALGQIHVSESGEPAGPVHYARLFYLLVIPGTVLLMLLHSGGDWVRKTMRLRLNGSSVPSVLAAAPGEFRMYGWERVQHGLLVGSFLLLVWTGFALRYPEHWWAQPLLSFEGNWPVRGTLHRISAVVMVVVSLLHLYLLASNRQLREHWLELLPKVRDVREGWQSMLYRVGLRSDPPVISAHGYIEKVEYWAVVWGTGVMAGTGFVMWFNNYALAFIPKMWIDFSTTVHFYEAILASLSIVVWHFYSVIFDPDIYPMDPAWWTGRSPRKRHHDQISPPEGNVR